MRARILLACVALGLMAACSSPMDARRDALAESRARWEATGPADYVYRYSRICFCLPLEARVEVRGGVVVSAVDPETGEPLAPEAAARVPTVEELFAEVEDALAEDPAVASIAYDPRLGYPTEAFFDFRLNVADEERGFSARELEALDPPSDGG